MTFRVDSKRVGWLLQDLCTQLGHCSAAREPSRFEEMVASGPAAFADAILAAEGINPEYEPAMRRDVQSFVAERFARWDAEGAT